MLREWTRADTSELLRVPTADDDKYSRGVVGLRTGSASYPGAAVLGVEAAWRAGAGYVLYTGGARDAVLARRPETVARDEAGRTRVGAWVIGSGTDAEHRDERERTALEEILRGDVAVVVDAGALDLAAHATAPMVLTPHAGEFRRLRAGLGLEDVDLATEDARVAGVVETASRLGATVLLKGSRTVIAGPDGEPIVIGDAPAWLSTAGSGDVLGGVIGALIAADPARTLAVSAAAAVWLHGRAAARASGVAGGSSAGGRAAGHPIVALDVAEALPGAIGELLS
ncbi:NAD(P)H-hydrate dehydratase [Microbacterium sp. Re1]|uniref:ADP-dependent (S)-NAD(P)H-hydrate dehydratase n=1 Tax=Microbacterium commune TaxID=2762219 RepID=A0ABR8W1M9_9MICO|nr:ADP/ATP-dependent (S)-NAD(P)H-hydrate dehydratase [Microbacterium commune]MBD8010921.1 NAD(P)H-hydrate dehydratase [Microbacterium commune]